MSVRRQLALGIFLVALAFVIFPVLPFSEDSRFAVQGVLAGAGGVTIYFALQERRRGKSK